MTTVFKSSLSSFPSRSHFLFLGCRGSSRWFFSAHRGGDSSDCLQAWPFSGWFPWWPWSPGSSCIFSAADSNLGEPFLPSPSRAPRVHGKFQTPHSRQEEMFRVSHIPPVSLLSRFREWAEPGCRTPGAQLSSPTSLPAQPPGAKQHAPSSAVGRPLATGLARQIAATPPDGRPLPGCEVPARAQGCRRPRL